jgi:chromosome partitioning protein
MPVADLSGFVGLLGWPRENEPSYKSRFATERAQAMRESPPGGARPPKYFVGRHRRTTVVRGGGGVNGGSTSGSAEEGEGTAVRGTSGSGTGLGWPSVGSVDRSTRLPGLGWPVIAARAGLRLSEPSPASKGEPDLRREPAQARVSRETEGREGPAGSEGLQGPARLVPGNPAHLVLGSAARPVPAGPARLVPGGPAHPVPGGPARLVPGGPARLVPGGPAHPVPDSPARVASDADHPAPYADDTGVRGQSPASPRHGRPLGWLSPGAAELTDQGAAEFVVPERGSATPAVIASIERPIPGGTASVGSDGPMIGDGHFGAERALIESEDEVAIPVAQDASVDTPIARAAQAAMKARSVSRPWPRPASCRILTVANQKGGVGKTTSTVNLAASLAMHGSRVLVVDLDPQGNASTALDVEHRSGTPSIYNVLVDGMPLTEVVRPVQGFQYLYCAPATIDLAGAEIELVPLVAREARLSRAVTEYDSSNLDYIFIDCPPSLGLLTVNALVAAPEVLIPIQCEYYALEGLEQLLRTVDLVKNHLNQKLKVSTILLTMFDSRTRLATQVADEVRSHFSELVLRSVIPRSVRVSEAPSYGQSVMTYDPGSSGALAYLEAAREMAFQNSQAATA